MALLPRHILIVQWYTIKNNSIFITSCILNPIYEGFATSYKIIAYCSSEYSLWIDFSAVTSLIYLELASSRNRKYESIS